MSGRFCRVIRGVSRSLASAKIVPSSWMATTDSVFWGAFSSSDEYRTGADGIFFVAGDDDGAGSHAVWMFCVVEEGSGVSGFVDLGGVVASDFHNAA